MRAAGTVTHGQHAVLVIETVAASHGTMALGTVVECKAMEFVVTDRLDDGRCGGVTHAAARATEGLVGADGFGGGDRRAVVRFVECLDGKVVVLVRRQAGDFEGLHLAAEVRRRLVDALCRRGKVPLGDGRGRVTDIVVLGPAIVVGVVALRGPGQLDRSRFRPRFGDQIANCPWGHVVGAVIDRQTGFGGGGAGVMPVTVAWQQLDGNSCRTADPGQLGIPGVIRHTGQVFGDQVTIGSAVVV